KALYGIYGTGGYGREVMPLARQELANQGVSARQLVFIDDEGERSEDNGHRVLTFTDFLNSSEQNKHVAIAIAGGQVREQLSAQLRQHDIQPWAIRDSTVVTMDDVTMDEGSILSPLVVLTSNIRIGKYFQANIYSYVGHDCVIGDFVTFAPAVGCNGYIVVEDHAYIGTGAILRQGTPEKPLIIGKSAVVGMGAVVTKDVPPDTTVVGNPARPLVRD